MLESDATYGELKDISQCPEALIDRLRHYFLTYKQMPNEPERRVEIAEVYDVIEAQRVITLSMKDYQGKFT